jgi:putative NADPH-quinone reductase
MRSAQADMSLANHLVLFLPLWLGGMPALLKGLRGRSARVVVTMALPAVLYRWYFRAHSVKVLERNGA